MRWILLDVVIALAALAVLAVLVLGLWRKVKALGATVREAGERVERATDALTIAQLGAVPLLDDPPGGPAATGARSLSALPPAAGANADRSRLRRVR